MRKKYSLHFLYVFFILVTDGVLFFLVIDQIKENKFDLIMFFISIIVIILFFIAFFMKYELTESEYKKLVLNYPIIRIPYADFILIHSVFGFLPWYVISYKKNYRQITGYMILPVNNSMEIVKTILDKNPNCVISNTLAKKVKRYEKYLERKERLPL